MTSRTVKNESGFGDLPLNYYEVNGQDAFARALSTSKFGKPVWGDDFSQPLQTFCGCRLARPEHGGWPRQRPRPLTWPVACGAASPAFARRCRRHLSRATILATSPGRPTSTYAGTVRVLVVVPARRTTSVHDADGTVVFAIADAHARGSIFASTREFLSKFGPTPD